MNLHEWAAKWRVPIEAIADLQRAFGQQASDTVTIMQGATSEGQVMTAVRLEAPRKGIVLWRNNVGALEDKDGRFVRYGLANDSKAVNDRVKSADLIGIRPVIIGPHHVGRTIGQFVSREIKEAGWHYTATKREEAQQRWLEIVVGYGGDAAFATGEGSL